MARGVLGTTILTLAAACPDDGGSDDGADAGGSTAVATGSADDGSGPGGGSATSTSAGSVGGSGESGAPTTGTPPPTTGATTTSGSDTGTSACGELDEAGCMADAACREIMARPYTMTNTGITQWCLGEPQFVGCIPAETGCTEAETTACPGDDADPWWFPDGCIPEFWFGCPAPTDGQVPDCP